MIFFTFTIFVWRADASKDEYFLINCVKLVLRKDPRSKAGFLILENFNEREREREIQELLE